MMRTPSRGKGYFSLFAFCISAGALAWEPLTKPQVERSPETPQQVVTVLLESMRHGRINRVKTLTTPVGWRALHFSPQKMVDSQFYWDTKARYHSVKSHQLWTIWKLWASRFRVADFEFGPGCLSDLAANSVPSNGNIVFYLDNTPAGWKITGLMYIVS